jgi:hypothetical protein
MKKKIFEHRKKQALRLLTVTSIMTSLAALAAMPTGKFLREMPKTTNEEPTNPSYEEMLATFKNPFGKVKTGTYWYWISGNISCEGVKKDLIAMKRAGIDRAFIGDISADNKQGPVKTFSPEWEKVLNTAFKTASEIGVEIGLFNSPGWSQSGGPWVKPEEAMRRFVSSSVVVDGPCNGVTLAQPKFTYAPKEHYRDVLAVAFPLPKGFENKLEAIKPGTTLSQTSRTPVAVEVTSEKPFTAQSVQVKLSSGTFAGIVRVETISENGKLNFINDTRFSRVNHRENVGFEPFAPLIASFNPVTAKKFRISIIPKEKRKATFSSISVHGAPLVAKAYEKSLAKMFESPLPMWHDYLWPKEPANENLTAFDPKKAIVLKNKISPDGKLDWQVPEGRWVIYRFGVAPTGAKNAPANKEATGYEVDKMSERHINTHIEKYIAKILNRTEPKDRKAIKLTVLDSYEMGGQNYTDDFAKRFEKSFGYNPEPFLPAIFGMSTSSRDDSDRFLWDLRRFIADEVSYSYVGGLRKAANKYGLTTWLECYGHWGFPGEFLQYGGQSDAIGGEFWSSGSLGNIENRAASSCGHIYGKREIWAESNTCGGGAFSRGPKDLKSRTDRFFADGINATILHLYIQQADDRVPGRIAWFGNEFNRHNTWFEHFDLFTGYLKRTGFMLQQGLNVADFAYFIGEDAPKMTGTASPFVPRGSQYDYINAEVLRETAGVDANGKIVLPHGTSYEVLILPPLETMRPEILERIEKLVNAGAFVIGPKPKRSPSLANQPQSDMRVKEIANRLWGNVDGKKVKFAKRGKGIIATGLSTQEALKMRGKETDVMYNGKHHLIYSHRTMKDGDIYFVAVFGGKSADVDVSFRTAGRIPEIWDAATGETRPAERWFAKDGRTTVNLSLAEHGSVFVVFKKNTNGKTSSEKIAKKISEEEINSWTMTFQSDAIHRGPDTPIFTEKLYDLSKSSDARIKFYSGRITYNAKFFWDGKSSRAVLDLGDVAETAKVKINGKYAGGVCFRPYRLDVTDYLRKGENNLEIEVCNLWINRLVGDISNPNRPTWTNLPCVSKKTGLVKSGLIGPVKLKKETK